MIKAARTTNSTKTKGICDIYLYNIPINERRELCRILQEQNVWKELAELMGYTLADVENIKWSAIQSRNSESEELLVMWGDQNHTITELFVLLSKIQQYSAMTSIKNLVDYRYHRLIRQPKPVNGNIVKNVVKIFESHQDKISQKILNKEIESFSNENNESYTFGNGQKSKTDDQFDANDCTGNIPKIDYEELRIATNNWSDNHVLGKGGFGTVFRGMWKLTAVAIKRIEHRDTGAAEMNKIQMQQSLNELRYLNSCRHDNILPLYGYSINGEEPCLVYQLMTGGSLAQRLTTKNTLLWRQRVGIAVGTARGLQYLHTFNIKPLIHGDIKPANILLDTCCQPKIGDFGLAREGDNETTMEVSRVYGTRPYLPMEFLGHRTLSKKVDTYSFGVVLLELATGLKAYDKVNKFLTSYVRSHMQKDGNVLSLLDRSPPTIPDVEQLYSNFIELALSCTDEKHEHRPEMVYVLKQLENKMQYLIPENN